MLPIIAEGTLTEEDVAAFERDVGATLPPTYRRWLAATNGGRPAWDAEVPYTDGMGVLTTFHSLVETNPEAQDLRFWQHRRGFQAAIPAEMLVIGGGGGGSLCLRLDDGSVWWADDDRVVELEEDWDEDPYPTWDVMVRLADDFDAFLAMFPDQPPDD